MLVFRSLPFCYHLQLSQVACEFVIPGSCADVWRGPAYPRQPDERGDAMSGNVVLPFLLFTKVCPVPVPCQADVALLVSRAADDVVRPRVPLSACLEAFAAPETIQDFYSSAIRGKTHAQKSAALGTFPPLLVLHMRKFVLDAGWVPRKLDVFVDVPDTLDLAPLRAADPAPDEQELPDDDDAPGEAAHTQLVPVDGQPPMLPAEGALFLMGLALNVPQVQGEPHVLMCCHFHLAETHFADVSLSWPGCRVRPRWPGPRPGHRVCAGGHGLPAGALREGGAQHAECGAGGSHELAARAHGRPRYRTRTFSGRAARAL